MKILSMTATFGKLEHQTLTLDPGLNVIHAPNEWGKSTWCAFLVAMLYGIDTRERSTQTALADKERYAPWSGSPMSGQIRLNWNGRDITIERRSKGRSVFGDFKTKVNRYVAFDHDDVVFNTEDSATALIHFENGATMFVETSWALNIPGESYSVICGTKAGAKFGPLTVFGEDAEQYLSEITPEVPNVNMFEMELLHFADCLENGTEPMSTLEDGVMIQTILQGIYDSAAQGKEVTVG